MADEKKEKEEFEEVTPDEDEQDEGDETEIEEEGGDEEASGDDEDKGGGEDKEATLKAELAELKEEITNLREGLQAKGAEEEAFKFEDHNYFADDEEFEKANAAVFNKKINEGIRKNTEALLKSLPKVVTRAAAQQVAMMRMADEFYNQNKDLSKYKEYVGRTFAKVMSDDPKMTYDKAMDKVADLVRSKLGLIKKAEGKKNTPAGPTGGRTAPVKKAKSGNTREGQIDQMNKALSGKMD